MGNKLDVEFTISAPVRLSLNVRELWFFRELFYFFTWRDVKIKYKQTVLGIFWAILQPLFMMLIFTFFFGRALQMETNSIPYPLFVFSGLILWNLFSSGVTNAGNSMVNNAAIIKKIYFPRLIIPVSAVLTSLVDLLFSLLVFAGLLLWYTPSVHLGLALLYWPLGVLLACLGTLGPGCWLAALNIKYRDFRYLIPFLVQALLFLTPVIYPMMVVHQEWVQWVLALNPMYAAIEIFRAPLMNSINPVLTVISISSGVLLLLSGLVYFKSTEMYFADIA